MSRNPLVRKEKPKPWEKPKSQRQLKPQKTTLSEDLDNLTRAEEESFNWAAATSVNLLAGSGSRPGSRPSSSTGRTLNRNAAAAALGDPSLSKASLDEIYVRAVAAIDVCKQKLETGDIGPAAFNENYVKVWRQVQLLKQSRAQDPEAFNMRRQSTRCSTISDHGVSEEGQALA